MRLLLAWLSRRKEREISFHHCGGPVMLVQACIHAGNILQRRFNRRDGAVKAVLAFLSGVLTAEVVLLRPCWPF